MSQRLSVEKTCKLYIGGAFPRSESGRTDPVFTRAGTPAGHASRASRKDLREAVTAARKALPGWAGATAYLRGQVLYRLAEMLEARRAELGDLLADDPHGPGASATPAASPGSEVAAAVDRLVHLAGWADKLAQVLGSTNPVQGPYWSVSTPQPLGVVGAVVPGASGLGGLVESAASVLCAGNAAVVVTEVYPPLAMAFAEACHTSDLPAGVVNVLTGSSAELAPVMAQHRDVDGVLALGVGDELAQTLRAGAGENLKRVTTAPALAPELAPAPGAARGAGGDALTLLAALVDIKTVWHPVGA